MFLISKRGFRLFRYFLLFPIIILFGCTQDRISYQEVEVVKAQSYYSDFSVEDTRVYIKCFVTVRNNTDYAQNISLCTYFPDDKKEKLLMDEKLYSKAENGDIVVYTIQPNSQESLEAIFIGAFAGNNLKQDRNLPDIEIVMLK